MDFKTLEEISESNNSLDDEQKEIQSKYIFERALDKFKNKQYKKTIIYIESSKFNSQTTYYWQILFLKLCSIQEIIERRLNKYYDSNDLSKTEKYLKKFNKSIKEFMTTIKKNSYDEDEDPNIDNKNKFECLITLILRQCHNYAVFCIYQNLLFDCLGFLGLGERLIKNTSDFFVSPDSLHYTCNIYIFLSSLYITSENYETAKRYLILSLKVSFKELELRLENDRFMNSLIYLSNFKNDEEILQKIFLNITICFYHLGVCYENEYDFESAYQSYKQSKWFGNVIPNNDILEFLITIKHIEKRELLRSQMSDFFKTEAEKIIEEPKFIMKKPKPLFVEEKNNKKFEKLQNFLNGLNLMEIDDEEPDLLNKVYEKPYSQKVGIPTKNVHLLNYLMEDKFKDVIYKMKKIEINKLDNKTKEVVQKQIIKMKNDERAIIDEKKKEKERRLLSQQSQAPNLNVSNTFHNKDIELLDIQINTNSQKKNKEYPRSRLRLNSNNFTSTRNTKGNASYMKSNYNNVLNNTDFSNINTYQYKTLNSNNNNYNDISSNTNINNNKNDINKKNSIFNKTNINLTRKLNIYKPNKKKKDEIEKIDYDFYVFSNKFRAKQNYLDKQFSRECKFQKQLLSLKVLDTDNMIEIFNKRKTMTQCEDFFTSTLKKELKQVQEQQLIKEEQNNKTNKKDKKVIMKNLPRIADYLSKTVVKKKKESKLSPQARNMKLIENLSTQIEEIDNIKVVLQNSYKRNLKKEIYKSARVNLK